MRETRGIWLTLLQSSEIFRGFFWTGLTGLTGFVFLPQRARRDQSVPEPPRSRLPGGTYDRTWARYRGQDSIDLLNDMLTIKAKNWKYETECRLILNGASDIPYVVAIRNH